MDLLVEAPPSYDTSTSKKWLLLVGPYLTTTELCSAILVCEEWNRTLSPQLWGCPTKHFALKPDDALISFIQFRRCLSIAKLVTRCRVHTLKLPKSMAELDYSAHPQWLLQAFQLMPCLQSIVFPAVPFLDHSTLVSFNRHELRTGYHRLKLVCITQGHNVTTQGLLNLLQELNDLMYIDLSGTRAARHASILSILASFPSLKVLNLVDLALGDDAATVLFQSIRTRVLCLNLSNNNLTDKAIQTLSSLCLNDLFNAELTPDDHFKRDGELSPASCRQFALRIFDMLTSGILPVVCETEKGVQYLDVSKNIISHTAVLRLISIGSLRGLDAGPYIASAHGWDDRCTGDYSAQSDLEYLSVPYQLVLPSTGTSVTGLQQTSTQRFLHTRLDSLAEVEVERQKHAQSFHGDFVSPILHPRLRILKLLDVPSALDSNILVQSLIELIRDCAFEQRLALLQTKLDYRLPPGQTTTKKRLERQAKKLFALEEIVLDIAAQHFTNTVRWSSWNHANSTQSVTGDADSQALWDAAASDFSFFGNEPVTLQSTHTGLSGNQQQQLKRALVDQASASFDTVSELSNFRKQARDEYNLAVKQGDSMPRINGFWNGIITVMRNPQ